jgi:hypothetical protein
MAWSRVSNSCAKEKFAMRIIDAARKNLFMVEYFLKENLWGKDRGEELLYLP